MDINEIFKKEFEGMFFNDFTSQKNHRFDCVLGDFFVNFFFVLGQIIEWN